MKFKLPALLLLFFFTGHAAFSQSPLITYSDPERNDSRRMDFEIIGKLNGSFLIYKNISQNDHTISCYDEDMKLKSTVKLDYIPERWINIDFINYPDFAYMIYQYQRRNIVYCMGVKLDAAGKKIGEPFEMDTTHLGFAANNKIYTTINSDDKKKIMVFKINSKNKSLFYFTTMLYDSNLQLLHKDHMTLPMEEKNEYFSDFMLGNDGELSFAKFLRPGTNSDYISSLSIVAKFPEAGAFAVHPVEIGPRLLDELKLKVDNTNKRLLVNAFYYKERRGNIEGLYTLFWDKATNSKISDTVIIFNDELRDLAKSPDANRKIAFNDYYIKNVTTRRDGGFLLIGESLYTTGRGNTFNRWDYYRWGSPWASPMDYYYYSPYYSPWSMPWGWGGRYYGYGSPYGYGGPFNNNFNANRYNANNIVVLSLDKTGRLEWSSVLQKSQYDDENDNTISFQTMNTGGEIHFLFNLLEKRTLLLTEQSIDPDGKVTRKPTLKNLDRGYEFMPRLGKQVSASQMIIPCVYRSSLCFAKLEW